MSRCGELIRLEIKIVETDWQAKVERLNQWSFLPLRDFFGSHQTHYQPVFVFIPEYGKEIID